MHLEICHNLIFGKRQEIKARLHEEIDIMLEEEKRQLASKRKAQRKMEARLSKIENGKVAKQ